MMVIVDDLADQNPMCATMPRAEVWMMDVEQSL